MLMMGKRACLGESEVAGCHDEERGKRDEAGTEWRGKGHDRSMRESVQPHKGKPGLGLKNSIEKPAQAVRVVEGGESRNQQPTSKRRRK
jgi:hypothetical protein